MEPLDLVAPFDGFDLVALELDAGELLDLVEPFDAGRPICTSSGGSPRPSRIKASIF